MHQIYPAFFSLTSFQFFPLLGMPLLILTCKCFISTIPDYPGETSKTKPGTVPLHQILVLLPVCYDTAPTTQIYFVIMFYYET